MSHSHKRLHHCRYFTASDHSHTITRIAEEAFRRAGLSPSHAFFRLMPEPL
jgi:hypothetical protein